MASFNNGTTMSPQSSSSRTPWILSPLEWFGQAQHLVDFIVVHASQLQWYPDYTAYPVERYMRLVDQNTAWTNSDAAQMEALNTFLLTQKRGCPMNILLNGAAVGNDASGTDKNQLSSLVHTSAYRNGWCVIKSPANSGQDDWIVHVSHCDTERKRMAVVENMRRHSSMSMGSTERLLYIMSIQWIKSQYVIFQTLILAAIEAEMAKAGGGAIAAAAHKWSSSPGSQNLPALFIDAWNKDSNMVKAIIQTYTTWWWFTFSVGRQFPTLRRASLLEHVNQWLLSR